MTPTAFRVLVLKLLFWSLGLGAVAGVLTVLIANDWVILRAMATLFSTAGAALVLLPLSFMIDRRRTREAGLLGTATVILLFLLLLGQIWEVYDYLSPTSWRVDESVWDTMGWLLGVAVPAMILCWARHYPATRVAGQVGLVLAAVFFVLTLVPIWVVRSWPERGDWWQTSAAVGVFGPLVIACLVGFGTDRRHWRWGGVVLLAAAALTLILEAWDALPEWEEGWSLLVVSGVIVAYANLVVRVPLRGGQRWVLWISLGAALATGALMECLIWNYDPDIVERMTAAAAIVTGCGTLALAVLARLNRRVDFEALPSEYTDVTIICPRCRKKQTVTAGAPAACGTCDLRIEVRVEEPRCAQCGYLLIGAVSDRCPECGTPVAGKAPPRPA